MVNLWVGTYMCESIQFTSMYMNLYVFVQISIFNWNHTHKHTRFTTCDNNKKNKKINCTVNLFVSVVFHSIPALKTNGKVSSVNFSSIIFTSRNIQQVSVEINCGRLNSRTQCEREKKTLSY